GEDRRRVEAGETEKVDRSVHADERDRLEVADDAVVLDRQVAARRERVGRAPAPPRPRPGAGTRRACDRRPPLPHGPASTRRLMVRSGRRAREDALESARSSSSTAFSSRKANRSPPRSAREARTSVRPSIVRRYARRNADDTQSAQ